MDELNLPTFLTEKQRIALRHVHERRTTKEIAARMNIAPGSVDRIIKTAMRTLGMSDRRAAADFLAEFEKVFPSAIADSWDQYRADAALRAKQIEQAPLGAIFEPERDFLVIDPAGDATDQEAAKADTMRQLHAEALRKIRRFESVAARLDNQMGWQGITALCERLIQALDRPTEEIPDHLGNLYSATLELGSFAEMDRSIRAGDTSYASPLDSEVRRPLDDALRGLAPWLRSFPTVRRLDDEAGQFLMPPLGLKPSAAIIEIAGQSRLINSEDAKILGGLVEAARRGELLGAKAERRGYLSARNMVVAVAGLLGGLVLDAYASQSPLIQKAATFAAQAETAISEIVSELPVDIRSVIELIVSENRKPAIPAKGPKRASGASPPLRSDGGGIQVKGSLVNSDGKWFFLGMESNTLVPALESNVPWDILDLTRQYEVLGRLYLYGSQLMGFTLDEVLHDYAPPEPSRPRKQRLF